MHKDATIYVAGHRGLVGQALVRALLAQGYQRLILRTSAELDLRDQRAVEHLFERERPEYVFLSAARVGGILANSIYPATFLYDNLAIELNVIHAAYRHNVKKLEFLGSSCIYPKLAPQPIPEEALLTGPLEATNEAYAIAKIAGIKLAQAYRRQYGFRSICLMPTNLYGPGDNFDLQSSHVLPAMIRKFHEGKARGGPVTLWGSGQPRREFLHVDDLASAAIHLMLHWDEDDIINVGTGTDVSIAEAAELIRGIVGYEGEVVYDTSKPDGTPRKLLNVSRLLATNWRPEISLADGIRDTYSWYLNYNVTAAA
ncbi:MAG TPA: GDP-L-fucose synthase [Terriglobia bacterium]|nr:GDP-L-fucose synthase [Terriglobia bacterium]